MRLKCLARAIAGACVWALVWALPMAGGAQAQHGQPASATSADGRWRLAADTSAGIEAPRLLLVDADGRVQREWSVATLDGKARSRVAAVHALPQRRSFVVALQDVAELWEISLDPKAEPIFDGLVHDYRMGEALAKPGYLGVRRTPLARPLIDCLPDATGPVVLGIEPPGGADDDGGDGLAVIHLDVRRQIARLALDGPADLAGARFVVSEGRPLLAVPNRRNTRVQWFDRKTWAPVAPPPDPLPDQPPG